MPESSAVHCDRGSTARRRLETAILCLRLRCLASRNRRTVAKKKRNNTSPTLAPGAFAVQSLEIVVVIRCIAKASENFLEIATSRSGQTPIRVSSLLRNHRLLVIAITAWHVMSSHVDDHDDDEYDETPLHRLRPFGAGIKRKRIEFVPQSSATESALTAPATKASLSDLYLSIVLPKKKHAVAVQEDVEATKDKSDRRLDHAAEVNIAPIQALLPTEEDLAPPSPAAEPRLSSTTCPDCNQPIDPSDPTPHSTTLHHQLSLPHSHPPSALNRTSMGYTYLSSYGFDVDARLGLGASGSGRLHPVRASNRADKDKLGIGATKEEKAERIRREGLDAGGVRKEEESKKKREQRMRDLVYGSDEVNKYLGVEL